MQNFIYSAALTSDEEDGGFVVTFRDLPEAISQGEAVKDALREAADCLEEAIANRIVMGLPIPQPTETNQPEHAISLSAQMAAKAALYSTIRDSGLTRVELAKRLQCNTSEVHRLLDPRHASELPRIEAALAAMGRQLVVALHSAA